MLPNLKTKLARVRVTLFQPYVRDSCTLGGERICGWQNNKYLITWGIECLNVTVDLEKRQRLVEVLLILSVYNHTIKEN